MFEPRGDELVRRVAADDAALEHIYGRFAECAEEMLGQAARRRPVPWQMALELAARRAADLDWWLTEALLRLCAAWRSRRATSTSS